MQLMKSYLNRQKPFSGGALKNNSFVDVHGAYYNC